ncbi:MAG: hypothetical protein KGL39_44770 [Patescibacteria group bacterium]|nr:hypothetical protein [Patescibacteria group bacterium]
MKSAKKQRRAKQAIVPRRRVAALLGIPFSAVAREFDAARRMLAGTWACEKADRDLGVTGRYRDIERAVGKPNNLANVAPSSP